MKKRIANVLAVGCLLTAFYYRDVAFSEFSMDQTDAQYTKMKISFTMNEERYDGSEWVKWYAYTGTYTYVYDQEYNLVAFALETEMKDPEDDPMNAEFVAQMYPWVGEIELPDLTEFE